MNHHHGTPKCTLKKPTSNFCCLKNGSRNGYKWNESATTRSMKIFKAGLKSKTWDIHGMPQFITTTHCEGCDMCKAYALRVVEASKVLMVEIPPRKVEKAFWITWLNIVCHIEDEASSVVDKKVEWYSNCHDNLTDNVKMVENKASAEWDCHRKADEKLAQANSKITELEAKLAEL